MFPIIVVIKLIQSLRSTANITLKFALTARLFEIHINILNTFYTSVVAVFKVVELNRWKILNSVGGLLGLVLEIEFYNVKENLLNLILPILPTPPLACHSAQKGTT